MLDQVRDRRDCKGVEKAWRTLRWVQHHGIRPIRRWVRKGLGRHFSGWPYGFTSHWHGRSNSCEVSRCSLQEIMRRFACVVGPDFILMQDIALAHTARVVIANLNQEGIDVMDRTGQLYHRTWKSNRTSVGHAPTTSFSSPETTSNRTDPNRDHADGGMECHRSGIHSQADAEHA